MEVYAMPVVQSNNLRVLMVKKGLTYRQVSAGAEVSTSTLQKIANNENVETDVLKRVVGFLGCRLSDLMEMESTEENE